MGQERIIRGGRVRVGGQWLERHDVRLRGGRISAIEPTGAEAPAGVEVIEATGLDVVPGFIDLHCHGAGGSDFMDATPEAVATITAHHAAGGTTAMLATTAGHPGERILEALVNIARAVEERVGACEILGSHLEGPYFSQARRGCHLLDAMRNPQRAEWSRWLEPHLHVRHLTLAPELPGALELVSAGAAAGVTVAAGHSDASHDEVMRAVEAGLRHVTHLYSVMSTITKRGPDRVAGLLEATLLEDALTTELIADNRHVNPVLARLAYKCKGPGQLALVTDAMRGLGMPDGIYTFGGLDGTPARVENGVAVNLERTGYASSTATMADCVRHCCGVQGQSYEEALERATLTPARIARVDGRKGRLAPGMDADLVLLGPGVRVELTISRGEVAYDRQRSELLGLAR